MSIKFLLKLKSHTKFIRFASLAAVFLTGILMGFILKNAVLKNESQGAKHFEIRESGFQYINPLLECENARDTLENSELKPFKRKVEGTVKNLLKSYVVSSISVYYRDLNSGTWFGIWPVENFYPASLLKVPLMIAVLKEAEADPHLLAKKIKYSGRTDDYIEQYINPSDALVPDRSYTIEDLLYRMIVYSDNNAFTLVEKFAVTPAAIKETYNVLSVEDPYMYNREYSMSVESYASFFRILYNATYLSKAMSEKALAYLAKAEFNKGLVAGVPSGIVVAHKFGERSFKDNAANKQLHDCGIIYYPGHPYLLCVMTKGVSFEYLYGAVQEVSGVVYKEIDSQHRSR